MDVETHDLMDGKLHVYKRENSKFWQCSTFMGQLNHRTTTKEENLVDAKDFARNWYMERCVEDRQRRRGIGPEPGDPAKPAVAVVVPLDGRRRKRKGPPFRVAAEAFVKEYQAIVAGERNARYVNQKLDQIRVHLLPFFSRMSVSEITSGVVQDYRVHRQTSRINPITKEPIRPARSTLQSEIVTLRQILKLSARKGWIEAIPDMSVVYKGSGKVSHRAWFSPDEYIILYEATRERAKNPKKQYRRWECEQLHDEVLFIANTGVRPDELLRIEDRDVQIVKDEGTGETILEIAVRGKRGTGYCKSMPGAVEPYRRVRERNDLKPTDRPFPSLHRELFNKILAELNLKHDREGRPRTAYSLRHSYICMRLTEGADIYQVAKNCRTSVEMIEKYYASHIKDQLDASAINVRKKAKTILAEVA